MNPFLFRFPDKASNSLGCAAQSRPLFSSAFSKAFTETGKAQLFMTGKRRPSWQRSRNVSVILAAKKLHGIIAGGFAAYLQIEDRQPTRKSRPLWTRSESCGLPPGLDGQNPKGF